MREGLFRLHESEGELTPAFDNGEWRMYRSKDIDELKKIFNIEIKPFRGNYEHETATRLADSSIWIVESLVNARTEYDKKMCLELLQVWTYVVYHYDSDRIPDKAYVINMNAGANFRWRDESSKPFDWPVFKTMPKELLEQIIYDKPDSKLYGCNILDLWRVAGGNNRIKTLERAFDPKKRIDPADLGLVKEIDGFQVSKGGRLLKWPVVSENMRTSDEPNITLNVPEGVVVIDRTQVGNRMYLEHVETLNLPSTLKVIGEYAFANTSIKYVNFSEGLEVLGKSAFQESQLVCIDLSKTNLTTIPENAFHSCMALTDVLLPDSVTEIKRDAFLNTSNLEDISLPTNLKMIDNFAFVESGLIVLEIPESVQEVGRRAFAQCKHLKSVILPEHKLKVEGEIFADCTALRKVVGVEAVLDSTGGFNNCPLLKNRGSLQKIVKKLTQGILTPDELQGVVDIPEGVVTIAPNCFKDQRDVTGIVAHGNLKAIGTNAFRNMSQLEFVDLSECVQLELIEAEAFKGCQKLKEIKLPEGVSLQIGNSAFADCHSLEHINLPDDVRLIPKYCFSDCTSLTKFKWPARLRIIGEDAFYKSGISNGNLPSRLQRLNKEAFEYCSNLTEVHIPAKVGTIPSKCFKKCKNLEKVYATDELASFGEESFADCTNLVDVIIESDDPNFDQYDEIHYDDSAFEGSPYEEVLIAAGVDKKNKRIDMYESRKRGIRESEVRGHFEDISTAIEEQFGNVPFQGITPVFTNNGFYDLETKGLNGYGLWMGYVHGNSGASSVKKARILERFVYDKVVDAVEDYLYSIGIDTEVIVEDKIRTTDMFRIYAITE